MIENTITLMLNSAIEYVRENHSWSSEQAQVALDKINEKRCNIEYADKSIADEISDLMDEYGDEYGFDGGWWLGDYDTNEIFLKLKH